MGLSPKPIYAREAFSAYPTLSDRLTTELSAIPASYRRAVSYAIKKARQAGVLIEAWHPNWLRHARATEIRHAFGIEAAQVVLGHARADVTQVYAEKNLELAMRIAQQTG
jgi:site-specific recombinase XerD